MKADPEKFNRLVAEMSYSAPITEEAIRELIPKNSLISMERAAAIVGMADMGMMPAAIRDMLDRYDRAEAHLRKRLGDELR
jgi:predicted sugar kinase